MSKATTYNHLGVDYKLLRSKSNFSAWAYEKGISSELLRKMLVGQHLVLNLGKNKEPIRMEVELDGNTYSLKTEDGWWAKIEDVQASMNKLDPLLMSSRPVRLVAKEKAWVQNSDSQIKAIRKAFEAIVWDSIRKTPVSLPGMRHYAVDYQLSGEELVIEHLLDCVFASPKVVKDSWVKRSKTNACLGYVSSRVEFNRKKYLQLVLNAGGGLQMIICVKSDEIVLRPSWYKDKILAEWNKFGWDGKSTVLRFEVRVSQQWLGKHQILGSNKCMDKISGDRFESLMVSIVKTILHRHTFCPGEGDKKKREMHPMWQFLCNCL